MAAVSERLPRSLQGCRAVKTLFRNRILCLLQFDRAREGSRAAEIVAEAAEASLGKLDTRQLGIGTVVQRRVEGKC